MGGYPNYTLLAKTAGIKTGFVGKTLFCLHHHSVSRSYLFLFACCSVFDLFCLVVMVTHSVWVK